MMMATPNLGIPFITHNETNGEATYNTGMEILDFHAQPVVVNHDQVNEPTSPVEGTAYIVGAGGTWSVDAVENDIAHFYNGTWHIYRPSMMPNAIGWKALSQANLNTYFWDGVSWGIYKVGSILVHDIAADADYTLSGPEAKHQAVKVTDTGVLLTVGRNIIVPVAVGQYVFINATAQTLTLKTPAGSGVAVATAKNAILFCDGVDVIRLSQDSS